MKISENGLARAVEFRRGGSSKGSASGSNVVLAEDDIVEDGNNCIGDAVHSEVGPLATRCSLRMIHDVVNKFDKTKRDLVKSTGFEGILHFPCIRQVNRKFALWLMSAVDEQSSEIDISEDVKLKFTKEDVCSVFGIPCSGKMVLDNRLPGRKSKDKVLKDFLGMQFKEHRSIKFVKDVIDRPYDNSMTKNEKDLFRVAFVVFVVSTLFCPSAKYDYASIDYWSAIQDADGIASYDWCEYVITHLLDSVKKLKQDLAGGVKSPNITGCSLFLQIFYLDSLDLGPLTVPQLSFPRIRDFSYECIRLMIRADHNFSVNSSKNPRGMPTKLRDRQSCCFHWASDQAHVLDDVHRSSCLVAVFEAAVAMARLLDVPMEAAGPLFVAASDFQQQVDSGTSVTGIRVIKLMTVLVSTMLSYKSGHSYHFSNDVKGDATDHDPISGAVSNGIRLLSQPLVKRRRLCQTKQADSGSNGSTVEDEVNDCSSHSGQSFTTVESERSISLHHRVSEDRIILSIKEAISSIGRMPMVLNTDHHLSRVMSQFYSMVRRLKLPVGVDLNNTTAEHHTSTLRFAEYRGSCSEPLRTPWELGYKWSMDVLPASDILSRVDRSCELEGFMIVHRTPKHIQVSTRAFRSQIIGQSEMEADLFDAFIRCVKQHDDLLYNNCNMRRWRHFFESDFMAGILSGSFDLSDSMIRQHFSITNMPYDIMHCKMLFFPALLQFRWVCYAWCLETNVLRVFDPSFAVSVSDSMAACHESNCSMLKYAMHVASGIFPKGWGHDWASADVQISTWMDKCLPRVNRSGVMCCMFCSSFDGEELIITPNMVDADTAAAQISQYIIHLRGNIGSIPQGLL